MFAIVEVGGKQYRAEVGRELVIDRLDAREGETVELKSVLVAGDGGVEFAVGDSAPAPVVARVVRHMRGPKLVVFKHKAKKAFKKKNGFRSALTRVSVEKIG